MDIINLNSLSDADKLKVRQLEMDVKLYAIASGLPRGIRFTAAKGELVSNIYTVSVDVEIYNTSTNAALISGTVSSPSTDPSLVDGVLVKIYDWVLSKI